MYVNIPVPWILWDIFLCFSHGRKARQKTRHELVEGGTVKFRRDCLGIDGSEEFGWVGWI